MGQASNTTTDQDQDRPPGRRRRRLGLELAGVAAGLAAGVAITLTWLVPLPHHHHPAPVSTSGPVLIPNAPAPAPDPAPLDAQWAAYSDHSDCADWAGGDGVSAIRLNSSQLAWFFSDTFIGPAGPTIGFSHLSGFVHNAVVVQTTTGRGSTFVTMTGGGACTGPGRPGDAAPVVGTPPGVPGGARYWDEDGIEIGGTVVKFYDHYLARAFPFVPVGSVIATFAASQLSSAGRADINTVRSPGRAWSRCRLTPRRPAAPRSCGAPRCCAPEIRCTSTARRARTCRSRATGSTWPGSWRRN